MRCYKEKPKKFKLKNDQFSKIRDVSVYILVLSHKYDNDELKKEKAANRLREINWERVIKAKKRSIVVVYKRESETKNSINFLRKFYERCGYCWNKKKMLND